MAGKKDAREVVAAGSETAEVSAEEAATEPETAAEVGLNATPDKAESEIERAMRESGIDASMLDRNVRDHHGNVGFVDHGSKIVFYCSVTEPDGKQRSFNRFWYRS